jgi:hypothetical protein
MLLMGADHERAIAAKLINSRRLAREAKALPILLKRHGSIFEIERRVANHLIKMSQISPHSLTSILVARRILKSVEGGSQSAHHL